MKSETRIIEIKYACGVKITTVRHVPWHELYLMRKIGNEAARAMEAR